MKICLLMWKNLVLRKRHLSATIFEILLPILLFGFLAYFRGFAEGPYGEVRGQIGTKIKGGTRYNIRSQAEMISDLWKRFKHKQFNIVGYSPKSSVAAKRIVEKLVIIAGRGTNVKVEGFASEKDMESYYKGIIHDNYFAEDITNFVFGVVFDSGVSSNSRIGPEISYKIRQSWDMLSSTSQILLNVEGPGPEVQNNGGSPIIRRPYRDQNRWQNQKPYRPNTGDLYDPSSNSGYGSQYGRGPYNTYSHPTDRDSYGANYGNGRQPNELKAKTSDDYVKSGFSGVQLILDKVLIEEMSNKSIDAKVTIDLQAMPYPMYQSLGNVTWAFTAVLSAMTTLSFIFIIPTTVREVVSEKESGIKELMKMAGLPEWMHWFSMMLNILMVTFITVLIITLLLFSTIFGGAIFSKSGGFFVWTFLWMYTVWATSYAFLVSSLFEKPAMGMTFGIMGWLVSYVGLGFGMDFYGTGFSVGARLALCLCPNVAMHLGFTTISQLENGAQGAGWSTLKDTIPGTNGVPLQSILLMMLASFLLNILLCLYFEAVLPKKYGIRKPFYFIFQPSEWGFSRRVFPSATATGYDQAKLPPTEEATTEVSPKEQNSEEKDVSTDAPINKDNENTSGGSAMKETDDMSPPPPPVVENRPGFEEDPQGVNIGVQILNLRKQFGSKVAVDDFSVNIFEDQIFCLLGENGAGKTTTMSILTGLISATSGTAVISGYDIRTGMSRIRQRLGLCPQHNMLFDSLTVMEHLKFFGGLKGLTCSQAEWEGKELISVLKFSDKANVLSTKLSGGQKRKLCLACALIGRPSVLFLDEPTSGMDPEARRAIWDVLLNIRDGRTIVLTTHFMEEADVLGDRIGILAGGRLQCCGSTSFLKRFYGAGFCLNMSVNEDADREKILNSVTKHIEGAYFKKLISNSVTEVSIVLPSDSNTTAKFQALFKELREKKKELKIDEVGLGWTTMDDVFVKVDELSHGVTNEQNEEPIGNSTESQIRSSPPLQKQNNTERLPETDDVVYEKAENELEKKVLSQDQLNPKVSQENGDLLGMESQQPAPELDKSVGGINLLLNQFYALLVKKLLYILRNKHIILSHMVLPLLLTMGLVTIGRLMVESYSGKEMPSLPIKLSDYSSPIVLYETSEDNANELGKLYSAVVKGSSAGTPEHTRNIELSLLRAGGGSQLDEYRRSYIVGAKITSNTSMTALHSNLAPHSPPLSINLLTNTILRNITGSSLHSIKVTNFPLYSEVEANKIHQYTEKYDRENLSKEESFQIIGWLAVGFIATVTALLPMVVALFTSSFVVEPTEERLNKGKHLQMMTGVNPFIYWGASFTIDFLLTLITISLIMIIMKVMEVNELFTNNEGGGVLFLILTLYSIAAIMFGYVYSTFVKSASEGFRRVSIAHIFTGTGLTVFSLLTDLISGYLTIPLHIASFFVPSFSLSKALIDYASATFHNSECAAIPESLMKLVCSQTYVYNLYKTYTTSNDFDSAAALGKMRCCEKCDLYLHFIGGADLVEQYCFQKTPYFRWSKDFFSLQLWISNGFDRRTTTWKDSYQSPPAISIYILGLAFMAVFYFVIIILIDYNLLRKIFCKPPPPPIQQAMYLTSDETDTDVLEEKERVRMLLETGTTYQDAVVVNYLCKYFGNFTAVSGLTFGVHYGECFGLLGVNGAGKTTAFKMLTGDENRSGGDAYMQNLALGSNTNQFMKKIGYCPQFDGINEGLTGKEMLCFYARLRGIPGGKIKMEAQKWLERTGLTASANVQCGKYSGGMKRRLSAAMALIGDPLLILLDEPTSGVDPVARRQFWKIISSVKNSGQAIILTSHSMEECESLCNRLGIMVNGELQCFGGVQHLKNKFAMGFSLSVKLNGSLVVIPPSIAPSVNQLNQTAPTKQQAPAMIINQSPRMSQQSPIPPYNQQQFEQVPPTNQNPIQTQLPLPPSPNDVNEVDGDVTKEEPISEVDLIIQSIIETFDACLLIDRHQTSLKFHIPIEATWEDLYQKMEKTKAAQGGKIEEYAITETSLEQVFLSFAKKQYTSDRPVADEQFCTCCRCCLCGC